MYEYDRRAASEKVWIYIPETRKFQELNRDDPRLDWAWPHAPAGMVRFKLRKNNEPYVNFGNSKQEAADSVNQYDLKKIAELEAKI